MTRDEATASVTPQELEAAHRRAGLYKCKMSVEQAMQNPMFAKLLTRTAQAYKAKKLTRQPYAD